MNTASLTESLKKSYFNIMAFFFEREVIESKYLRCLLKWGLQLNLNKEDLVVSNMESEQLKFQEPEEKFESIFHLVYLIYMDNEVEDIELEVAMVYSERLGFDPEIIQELVAHISTNHATQLNSEELKAVIREFIRIHLAV
jgi:hypothetical protein